MKCNKNQMLLYAVTDRAWTQKQSLYQQVEDALKGGVTCVQLREKELDEKEFLIEAIQMAKLCRQYDVPFIVNDNVDIALQCGADGIHVGQEDMVAWQVRQKVGDKMIVGVSVHTVEQAIKAVQNGADYLGVGAMFSTSTKTDIDVLPWQTLKDICNAVDVPVVAIGGINKNNMQRLAGSGVDGVALVSAIFASDDIQNECQQLKMASQKMVSAQKIKGAVFDFDGTLFDSMFVWDMVAEKYVTSLGKKPQPELREKVRALSLVQSAELLKKEYALDLDVQQIMQGINDAICNFYYHEVLPKKGATEFVKKLRRKGVKTCIATATDRYLIQKALQRCGMQNLFDGIFTCGEVGFGKDTPVVFNKAMEFLGTDKQTTVVFEDALHAIKTAKQEGFFVVAVFDESEKRQDEIKQSCHCYIQDFSDTDFIDTFI